MENIPRNQNVNKMSQKKLFNEEAYSTEDKHYHQFEHYDTTLTRFRYNTVF